MSATLLVALLAGAALAFGAVYPWAYVPALLAAATIGIIGVWRGGVPRELRGVAAALGVLTLAVGLQLVPLPRSAVAAISPATIEFLNGYNVAFASGALEFIPLSVDPGRTRIALFALVTLGVYLLGLAALLRERDLRRLPVALAIFAVPFALFGIYTREHNDGLMYGFWRPVDGGASNQAGSFVNRNHFAGWMLMASWVVIGAVVGLMERRAAARRAQRMTWLSSEDLQRLLLWSGVVVILLIGLFWPMSRSAILGCAASAILFVWLAGSRTWRGHPAQRRVAIALLAAIAAAVAWRGPSTLAAWFLDERNLIGRMDAWRDGWRVASDFPLVGTGLNTYPVAMLFYQTRNLNSFMAQAHNDYVQLAAEGGLLVALPVAAAIVTIAAAVRRNLKAASGEVRGYWIRAGAAAGLVGIAIQEIFEFSLQIPADALLCATLAAVALTPPRYHAHTMETCVIPSATGSANVPLPTL